MKKQISLFLFFAASVGLSSIAQAQVYIPLIPGITEPYIIEGSVNEDGVAYTICLLYRGDHDGDGKCTEPMEEMQLCSTLKNCQVLRIVCKTDDGEWNTTGRYHITCCDNWANLDNRPQECEK